MIEPSEERPALAPVALDPEIAVPVGECRCPGAPHVDGDLVWLWREVPLEVGIAAYAGLEHGQVANEMTVVLGMAYLRHGISRWSFLDEDGLPEPIANATIKRLLPWTRGGFEVAEKAGELYDEDVTRPLLQRLSKHSLTGPTGQSTLPNRAQRRARPRRSG